jgi:hypothetical protein
MSLKFIAKTTLLVSLLSAAGIALADDQDQQQQQQQKKIQCPSVATIQGAGEHLTKVTSFVNQQKGAFDLVYSDDNVFQQNDRGWAVGVAMPSEQEPVSHKSLKEKATAIISQVGTLKADFAEHFPKTNMYICFYGTDENVFAVTSDDKDQQQQQQALAFVRR